MQATILEGVGVTVDWSLVEAARSYAERGWAVFPLHSIKNKRCTCGRANDAEEHSPGKHPRTKNGLLDATTDVDQIQAWWIEWPDANVGIRTGLASHIAVGDVDPRNGGYDNPDLTKLPTETLCVQTGGGGIHLYYALTQSVRTHDLGPGLELKADGGYVVAPPSNHVDGRYTWVDQAVPLAPMPTWAVNGATPQTTGPIIVEPDQKTWVAQKLTEPCPKGTRHRTLIQLAGYFRNITTETVAQAILGEWNDNYCQPTLPTRNVREAIADVYSRYTGVSYQATEEWTSENLLTATFPPLVWIVQGLLPEGLCFLAGRPKRGKSWLALQIAVDVVAGGSRFGETSPGRVLYFALEDTPRRLQARLMQMGATGSPDLIFHNKLPSLDQGGLVRLLELMDRHEPNLVVIDTLSRVMGRKRDQDSTADMTDFLAPLQEQAFARHACILPIEHHRKPSNDPSDMIDDISGSTAKAAVPDGIMGLYRKTGEATAILKVTGRDIQERDLSLTWDALRFQWRIEAGPGLSTIQRQIIEAARILKEATSASIAHQMGVGIRIIQGETQELVSLGLLDQEAIQNERRGRPTFLYRVNRNV